MTLRLFPILVSFFIPMLLNAQVKVLGLTTENRIDPLGIGTLRPVFGWKLRSEFRGTLQTAYEIRLQEESGRLGYLWQTGKRYSSQSIWIKYSGPSLRPKKRYSWRVRVWDNHDQVSDWSKAAFFQIGLPDSTDWKADWISPGYEEDTLRRSCPLFRHSFILSKAIRSATLYITAHGLYEAWINGRRVGKSLFTPGWTSYDKRLQYQAYDVTALVQTGENATGVMIGDGWWRGVFGPFNKPNNYGKDASLLFQLAIFYQDGSEATVVSDSQWRCSTGPIRYSDLYNGEVYDSYWEKTHWSEPGYSDSDWNGVRLMNFSKGSLVATISEPVREQEVFRPVKLSISPKGERILDFGQNLAGWVRLKLHGKAGDTIRISHAEWLDKYGNFYTSNLREARAQDVYILQDDDSLTLEPHFTFHGFRYVKIEGYRGELNPDDFETVALYSNLDRTGAFSCSNPLINRLQQNIVWSQQSNFLDIPSDCPQRSERLGWTGDAEIFARTAAFNRGVENFFSKWLADLIAEQGMDGGMPNIIPDLTGHILHRPPGGVAGWGDAATILPWTLFLNYGETDILKRQYSSMKKWVDYIRSQANEGLWQAEGYGDWSAPGPVTDLPTIDQCFYFHSTALLIKAAKVLGNMEDFKIYTALLDQIREVYLKNCLSPDGKTLANTQTSYVLPLYFELVPDSLKSRMVNRLIELIQANHDHLATGFLGTPYLLPVLSRYGHADLAFTLLNQETPPSWLYPIKAGATTIWEKWDAVRPDGSQDTCSMNHYAYGAVGDWLYRVVAGIDEDEGGVGYRLSRLAPLVGGGLTLAGADLETPYGKLSSYWRLEGMDWTWEVEIPANTHATLVFPQAAKAPLTVGSGRYHFRLRLSAANCVH
jgi:alpha-L-rhamnosidase